MESEEDEEERVREIRTVEDLILTHAVGIPVATESDDD